MRQRTHTFNAAILRRRAPPRARRPPDRLRDGRRLRLQRGAPDCGVGRPARRTSRRPSPSAGAAGEARPPARLDGGARRPPRGRLRRAAAERPTDAEVQRELEQAFGSRAGRAIDAAGLGAGGLATVPPAAPVARGGHHQRRQLGRAQALRLRRRPRAPGRRDLRRHAPTTARARSPSRWPPPGLVDSPMDSSALARFGRPGPGRWVTIYANAGHAFMTVAGLRFDTSGRDAGGSRWQAALADGGGLHRPPPAGALRSATPRRAGRDGASGTASVWLVARPPRAARRGRPCPSAG